MPAPTIKVEVGWTDTPGNIFELDSSVLDGLDVLDGLGVGDFSGPYDDVTADVGPDSLRIRRGRSDTLATMQAGTCEFTLIRPNDPDYYNPNSLTSPIAFQDPGFAPMRPVRVTATYDSGSGDVDYPLFYGFLRSMDWDSDSRTAKVQALDLFLWLSRTNPSFTITDAINAGVSNTSEAIGLVLDEALWTDPAKRDLATSGGDTVDPTAASFGYPNADKSALNIVEELLAAERGVAFASAAGTFVYKDRNARAETDTITATFNAQQQLSLGSSLDLDKIINRVRVTRTGGSTVTEEDATSQSRYGINDFTLDSKYIPSFSASQNLAKWLIRRLATPQPPVEVTLENDTSGTLVTQLSIELGDRVEAPVEFDAFVFGESAFGAGLFGGDIGSYHVEQIEHQVGGGGLYLSTRLLLSARGADGDQFLFGYGEFGDVETGTFGY
jgi:hypothetical protein